MTVLFTTAFFIGLLGFYISGVGGPMLVAVAMVPMALAIMYLQEAQDRKMPRLLAVLYAAAAVLAATYLVIEFDAIRVERVGIWNLPDHLAAGTVALLVLEFARRRYYPLFVLNLALLVYAFTGPLWPGALMHGGIDPARAASLVSLEMSTGVFDRLAQLGLTLIGAFILVLAVLRAFGSIDSILRLSASFAARRPALLPQAAVAGSFAVAAVSGSGAANAATTGAATIPALIRSGLPRVQAAAVETASSLGGQLMPPLMGIAAFMMAELMGVGYFEVAARGFAPALVYFCAVSATVYLLAMRHGVAGTMTTTAAPEPGDRLRVGAYALAIVALVVLMGVFRQAAMTAALNVFWMLLVILGLQHLHRWRADPTRNPAALFRPLATLARTFSSITAELTVLLAILGMLTALFTVTGIPMKVGALVLEMAAVHVVLMVAAAAAFGLLVGMGLPAAPTYIILAVVITPFMVEAGIDPWVAHFFAFLVAVTGELTPPTSVTAAVAARIADAPFLATMMAALRLCTPLLLMIGAVFTRPELVLAPGLAQLGAWALVTTGCIGVAVVLHDLGSRRRAPRLLVGALAATAALTLFHPSPTIATVAAGLVFTLLLVWWSHTHRTN